MSDKATQAKRVLEKLRAKRIKSQKETIERQYASKLLKQHKWHQAQRKKQQVASKQQSQRQLLANKFNSSLQKNKPSLISKAKEVKYKVSANKGYKVAKKVGGVSRNIIFGAKGKKRKMAGKGVSLSQIFKKRH